MNYCPRCKLRMPAEAATCEKCGGQLRTVGAPADAAPGTAAAPTGDLALQLAGLQHQVQQSRRRLAIVAALAGGLLALLVALLVGLHLYEVTQFAEVSNLKVSSASGEPGAATIAFSCSKPGKVEFVREAAGRTETLVEHGGKAVGDASRQDFTWSGGEHEDYTIVARYRSGWSLREERFTARGGEIRSGD